MTLKRIRLELARDHDFPDGSRDRGYEFAAPLDPDGRLAAAEWKNVRERCRVKRFWAGETTELGRLVHKRGGAWAFDYDPSRDSDDETGFKLSAHRFLPGEYVSFKEHDGVMRTFRVAAISDVE
jgi:hypothetical protein